MPLTTIAQLKQYISNNSSSTIRSRAKNIFLTPEHIDIENNSYIFSYVGSAGYLYEIYVRINRHIYTDCGCPYDYGGICKHEVAAVNFVIELLQSSDSVMGSQQQSLFLTDEIDKQLQKRYLFLENHLLSESFVDALMHRYVGRTNYFAVFELKKVIDNEIFVKVDDFSSSRRDKLIHFNYDVKKQHLHFTYDEDLNIAYTIRALVFLVKVLGENFFDPAFKQQKISEYIQHHNIDERYLHYYDFMLNQHGIHVTSKIKNLHTNTSDIRDGIVWNDQEKDCFQVLPAPQQETTAPTHGIGFCFEIDKDYFAGFNFWALHGKYKKNTRELYTSFKAIDEVSFSDFFPHCSRSEKFVLTEWLDVFLSVDKLDDDIPTKASLRHSYIVFCEFVKKYHKDYPFFIKPSEHTSLVRKNMDVLAFSETTAKLIFTVSKNTDFVKLVPKIQIDNKSYQINSRSLIITPFFCIKDKNTVYFFESPKEFVCLFNMGWQAQMNFPADEYHQVENDIIQPLAEQFVVENKLNKPQKLPSDVVLKKELYLADFEGDYIVFKLGVRYDKQLILVHNHEPVYDEKNQQYLQRDEGFEANFIDDFQNLHPDFAEQNTIFYLRPEQLIENDWLLKTSQKLKQQGVQVFGAKDLKSFKYSLHKPSISMSVASDIDWFDIKLTVKFGNEQVSLKDIRKAVINRSKYVALKDGTLGILPEQWLKKIAKYFKAGEVKGKEIKVSNYQFNILDDLCDELENTPKFLQDLQRKKESLHNLHNIKPVAVPKSLNAQLRPYQQDGLNWLVFLYENNLGGCLADDMGLGKTLQTIALLAYIKEHQTAQKRKPNLVVAPTSLIFNWQQELQKFAPTLKVLIYTGSNRQELLPQFTDTDVIITTYGSVLNDREQLQQQAFNYVILDESQAIKNPQSKRYKAVRLLSAENRLALTGTPIENNTFDLYAQMNFINPGLLGSIDHFKSEFSDAIDKDKNRQASHLLHEMIYPFLLRRTKQQVASDLPEKTENIIYCDMGNEQRSVYDAFKEKYRDYLLKKIAENGSEKAQMYVLQGLTKLRQICNSPQLLNDEEEYTDASAKLDVLLENIVSITAQGSKILVFSQFTSMLALVKERLDLEGIAFEYLDGQTRNRQERVDNFQNNDDIQVFLISLKAGGTGLNLTKAEYVFLLDPWWNPAVENQAIDRCYRIGQTKNVIAYRMICKDTIEEKIVALQSDKQQVSDSIIQIDNESKSFDSERVKELFG